VSDGEHCAERIFGNKEEQVTGLGEYSLIYYILREIFG
jgi:hypothetical protein